MGQLTAKFLIIIQNGGKNTYKNSQEEIIMGQPLIDLVNISKSFDGSVVLDDLNLSVKENTFVTLLGPSGCGKTTTLRIMGGFETADTGNVIFDGQDITHVPPNKRQLNTVFQKYALFSHMNIADNIAFGLKIKNKSKAYIDDKIKYALKLVNLDGYEKRSINSLSGGQQRIAIARAIVNEPRIASGRTSGSTGSETASGYAVRTDPPEKPSLALHSSTLPTTRKKPLPCPIPSLS